MRIPFIAVVFLTSSLAQGQMTQPAKPANIDLPIIGTLLGSKASTNRAIHSDVDEYKDKTGQSPSLDYFILGFPLTISVELEVDKDRVSKVIAFVRKPTVANAASFDKRLASITDKRASLQREEGSLPNYPNLLKLTFSLVPSEVYISENHCSDEVAKAIREAKWVRSMSREDQMMVNDGPGTYVVTLGDRADLLPGYTETVTDKTAFVSPPAVTIKVKASSQGEALRNSENLFDARTYFVRGATLDEPD